MEKSGSNLVSPIMGHIGIIGVILMYKCVKDLLILGKTNSDPNFQGTHSSEVADEKTIRVWQVMQ